MLGKIIIGNENSAGYLSMTGAPTVTSLWINSPSASAYLPRAGVNTFRQAGLSSLTEVAGNDDVQRITYFTPSFNGLTVGVSYAAGNFTNAGNNSAPDRDAGGAVSDIFDIGVNYTQSFGGVDVTLAGRWGTGDRNGTAETTVVSLDPATVSIDPATGFIAIDPDAVSTDPATSGGDPTTWGIGGRLGTNGFVLGASYTENDSDIAGGADDQKGWSLGVTYDIAGPWSVEALTYQGEVDNGSGVSDSDYEAYRVGAARDLGPGVKWEIFYIHSDTKNGTNGNKIEGDMIGTGLSLSF
jgi:predicted porin